MTEQGEAKQLAAMTKAQRTLLALKGKREDIFHRAQSFLKTVKTLTQETYLNHLTILSRCQSLRDKFDEVTWEIVEINTWVTSSEQLEVPQVSAAFEQIIETVESIYQQLGGVPASSQPGHAHDSNASINPRPQATVRLPKLELRHFSGKVEDWISYYNIFNLAVHSVDTLSPVQKFQYLLSTLEGEALHLVQGLEISAANYVVAHELLRSKYHNERRLVAFHINSLLDLDEVKNNAASISRFLVKYREHSQALNSLKHNLGETNEVLVAVFLRKFTFQLRTRLEDFRGASQEFPKIEEIIKFLEKEAIQLEDTSRAVKPVSNNDKPNRSFVTQKSAENPKNRSPKSQHSQIMCSLCGQNHALRLCSKFLSMAVSDRESYIKDKKRCKNCLGLHEISACTSNNTCSICKPNISRHHSLLHKSPSVNSDTKPDASTGNAVNLTTLSLTSRRNFSQVMLGTVLVHLSSPSGRTYVAKALLDNASQRTIITTRVAKALRLNFAPAISPLSGLSQVSVGLQGTTRVTIATKNNSIIQNHHDVDILDSITAPLPSEPVPTELRKRVKGMQLADPLFYIRSPIDCLIGADIFPYTITGAPIMLAPDLPIGLPTMFGVALMGKITIPEENLRSEPKVTLLTVDNRTLHDSVQRLWTFDQPLPKKELSEDEIYAEKLFTETHSRQEDGRYVVKIPFKKNHPPLGESRNQALRRFHAIERYLACRPDEKAQYIDCMEDYIKLGHMVPVQSVPEKHYFLPHHGVKKDSSSSTKLRVVFDGSAKTSTGVSLNDIQLAGPHLQIDIRNIINNFRRHKFMFTCDIKQMYRQIALDPDDQYFQLVFWRSHPTEPIRIYKLTRVSFGICSSAFLSLRTLRQLALDHGHEFPCAARMILKETFVDNITGGAPTVQEMIANKDEMMNMLHRGGFVARKFTSNSQTFLETVDAPDLEPPLSWDDSPDRAFAFLGLIWLHNGDCFAYRVNPGTRPFTKRGIISTTCSIFDPCGWLAPAVFLAKALIQQLWITKIDWDDPLPAELTKQWTTFLADLPSLKNLRIPRFIPGLENPIQVHGFCDASERGYCAVVYLRTLLPSGDIETTLLQTIGRIAPLQRVTLPRLELCGADLLCELLQAVLPSLRDHHVIEKIHAWSDSTITLQWISTPPYKLSTYVANRVSRIQTSDPELLWGYVPSAQNPADLGSRGLMPSQLLNSTLWFHGPEWLKAPSSEWPRQPAALSTDTSELKKVSPIICTALTRAPTNNFIPWDKFSSWPTLQHVYAYVLRFIFNARQAALKFRENRRVGSLSVSELQCARDTILKKAQLEEFSGEIEFLDCGKGHISTKMQRLSPFLDSNGLLRVGGRISHASIAHRAKHQILLPTKHKLTDLVVAFFHEVGLHSGPQLTQSLLNEIFWIISARKVIRSVIFQCIPCFRAQPRNRQPLMGDLPAQRVKPSRPFAKSGMDYCGSFDIKIHTLRAARTVSCYLCIFVCMATKGVHIEVVEDLSTLAFLGALTRFASRRGWPTDLYSDCGTNFVGADRKFKKALDAFFCENELEIQNFSTQKGLTFHFQSPAAPFQGGLWEAAVKSVKKHILRTIGNTVITLIQFQTLVSQIEAILNSRPLTPLSNDPSDFAALTPAHFLTGGPIVAPPMPDFSGPNCATLKHWRTVEQFSRQIWQRWQHEYLQTLQTRSKWTKDTPNLRVGDLVLLHEPNCPPLRWKYARVTQVHPGKDGAVRVAQVKTAHGEYTRPATKLYPLPVAP